MNFAADAYVKANPGFTTAGPKPIPVTMQNAVRIANIADGTSNTLFVGEKFISPKYYQPGNTGSLYQFQWGTALHGWRWLGSGSLRLVAAIAGQ
jgi:hypothetical protein